MLQPPTCSQCPDGGRKLNLGDLINVIGGCFVDRLPADRHEDRAT